MTFSARQHFSFAHWLQRLWTIEITNRTSTSGFTSENLSKWLSEDAAVLKAFAFIDMRDGHTRAHHLSRQTGVGEKIFLLILILVCHKKQRFSKTCPRKNPQMY